MLSTPQKKPPLWILFASFALLALVQWPSSFLIQNVSLTWGVLLNEWLFVAGIPFLIAWQLKIPFQELFPFKRVTEKTILWVVVMTLSLVVVIEYLTFLSKQILPPPLEVKAVLERIMTVGSVQEGIGRWFLICLTPAFCEEFFFRGFFQNTLAVHKGKIYGLWITAAAFALIHGIPWYWHLYFILGFYLSWLLMESGNLWFPVLAHLINNSWTFIHHALGNKIPVGGSWQGTDSLVLGICVVVFALASFQFTQKKD